LKLTLKVALTTTLLTMAVIATLGFMSLRQEASMLEAEIGHESLLVATSIAHMLEGAPLPSMLAARFNEVRRDEPEMAIGWRDPSVLRSPELAPQRSRLESGQSVVVRQEAGIRALVPVIDKGNLIGVVDVFESMARRDAFIRRALFADGLAVLLVMLLCGAAAVGMGRQLVGARVDALIRSARDIGRGRLTTRFEVNGGDELAVLACEMNLMAAELQANALRLQEEGEARLNVERQLRHADRLTTVGQLSAGMAHELGTPLNVISGRAGLIAQRVDDDSSVAADAQTIREQARRITAIVQRMLQFSRRETPKLGVHDLVAVVRGCVDLLGMVATKADVEIQFRVEGPSLDVRIDPEQMRQVVTNLMMNAIQAMPTGGTLTLLVKFQADEVQIQVEDAGQGITTEALPRLFDPFFTTKPVGKGTGLGLSVVHGIVKDHGGTLAVHSVEGQGATFTVHLPANQP